MGSQLRLRRLVVEFPVDPVAYPLLMVAFYWKSSVALLDPSYPPEIVALVSMLLLPAMVLLAGSVALAVA